MFYFPPSRSFDICKKNDVKKSNQELPIKRMSHYLPRTVKTQLIKKYEEAPLQDRKQSTKKHKKTIIFYLLLYTPKIQTQKPAMGCNTS
jgi:hypothetical protein